MTKEKYMALADFQTLWTNTLKPYIVAGFIAMLAGTDANAKNLVLADGTNIAQSTFIPATEKAANNGVATLGADGKVPASQLPSFVDDVIEAANFAALPAEGEGGKIYVTLDDNKTYRWGGTTYVIISDTLALGETQGTAYEGSKGKALKDAFDAHEADTDIHITASERTAWNAKYDKPATGIPSTDMTAEVQASLAKADSALQQHQDISGKADKVASATNGNFAGLDANGNLTDSGSKAADFATAAQGGKADTAIQSVSVNGVALTPDADKGVDIDMPERVTAADLATFVV